MNNFSHIDDSGNATMVDVSGKKISVRTAKAQCTIAMPPALIDTLASSNFQTHKGSVFQTAIIAGIMAAKKTGDLIPLCHPIGLNDCKIDIGINENKEILIICSTIVEAKTGVEMEALTGVSVAALTIYDMCKAFSHDIVIKDIKLMEKSGGKNDFKRTP